MAELAESAQEAESLLQKVIELLAKSSGMAVSVEVLRCTTLVVPAGVRWSLTEAKKAEWVELICEHLRDGALPGGAASKLVCHLGFASSKVFGRIGRAWIWLILWRQQHNTPAWLDQNRRLRTFYLGGR